MKLQVSMNALLMIKEAFEAFSPVSLLANLSGDVGEVDQEQLKEQKIYDDNGLTDEAKALFGRMNQAIKAERTLLLTPIGQIQRVVYHFEEGPVISVNQKDSIFVIEDPGEVEKSLALYRDIFGTSDTMVTEIDYDLKELEALVLAGIMDLRIELSLSVLLGIEPREGLTQEMLLAYFSKPLMNSRLAPLVYGLMEDDTYNLPSEQLTMVLGELVTKGCIELDGDEIAVEVDQVGLEQRLFGMFVKSWS